MEFDLRTPIGLLFIAYGAILAVYGVVTPGAEMYAKSLGTNINLWWGIVMLIFGGIMYAFALVSKRREAGK
jgi:uncharacterized membrane protein YeiB